MAKKYELVLIIDPQIGDTQLEAAVEKYKTQLESSGAEVVNVDPWGLRKLAYTSMALRQRQQAFYVLYQFEGDSDLLGPLDAANGTGLPQPPRARGIGWREEHAGAPQRAVDRRAHLIVFLELRADAQDHRLAAMRFDRRGELAQLEQQHVPQFRATEGLVQQCDADDGRSREHSRELESKAHRLASGLSMIWARFRWSRV